jgi:hypothetical protein
MEDEPLARIYCAKAVLTDSNKISTASVLTARLLTASSVRRIKVLPNSNTASNSMVQAVSIRYRVPFDESDGIVAGAICCAVATTHGINANAVGMIL